MLHAASLDRKQTEKEERQSGGWKPHKNPGQKGKPRGPPPSKPNKDKTTQSWLSKTREKTTSPRAKLQTSAFIFKSNGTENVLWMEQEKGKRRVEEAALHGVHISFLEIPNLEIKDLI